MMGACILTGVDMDWQGKIWSFFACGIVYNHKYSVLYIPKPLIGSCNYYAHGLKLGLDSDSSFRQFTREA